MHDLSKYLIVLGSMVTQALEQLNSGLGDKPTLFVVDDQQRLQGSLTDGDIRRGIVEGKDLSDPVEDFMYKDCRFIEDSAPVPDLKELKASGIHLIPLVQSDRRIIRLYNLLEQAALLPLEAVIMCGGEGQRLRPLTLETPKPPLKVGDKPILQHNLDRLKKFGIKEVHLTVRYLAQQIIDYYGNGDEQFKINCIKEDKPLGTMGAVKLIPLIKSEHVIIMNADLLTNIDFAAFYKAFLSKGADMAVATVPYTVKIPYAVLETEDQQIVSFQEKPTYTYYSNAGIYIVRKELLNWIPQDEFYDATDFMKMLIDRGKKLTYFPILGYWQDIGKMEDFKKAQQDVTQIKL